MKSKKDIERKPYLDYLRVASCLAVVLCHIFTTARTDFPNHTTFEEIFSVIMINCTHFAVPIFFMITGTLFLNKKEMKIKDYLKKYVLKYVIAIFTFGYGFAIIEEVFNKNYSLLMPLNALINTIQGKSWAHMWYLYTLVGVMLIIPILRYIANNREDLLKYILIILIISSFVIPLINNLFNIEIGIIIPIESAYLVYVILGYLIDNNGIKKNKEKAISYLLIVFSIAILVTFAIISIIDSVELLKIFAKYNSIIIMLLSVGIFIALKNVNYKKSYDFILNISKDTYGVYLLHMFWINVFYKFLKFNIYGDFFIAKGLVLFTATFLLSTLSTKIMKKIPGIKNII